MPQKIVQVCLTPDLTHLYDLKDCTVVVTDIFRATSCMVTGFAHNLAKIIPVATVEECKNSQDLGYIAAAERDAQKVPGFDLDNSPFSFMDTSLNGKSIAMTTTNGTFSIAKVKDQAKSVLIGAFLNLDTLARYLSKNSENVMILCAGWKGTPSLEDSLFAGALTDTLIKEYDFKNVDDSSLMTQRLYLQAQGDLKGYLMEASHLKRLKGLGIQKDIDFCLEREKYAVVPILEENTLILTK
jgi:2-phosphosulfolactate phosphatase